jgi:hypothetical protein
MTMYQDAPVRQKTPLRKRIADTSMPQYASM